MSFKIPEMHHKSLLPRSTPGATHAELCFIPRSAKGEVRPMSNALLQLMGCHRRVARSGTGRACVSEHHQSPFICISWQTHCRVGLHLALFGTACLRETGRLSSFCAEHMVLTPDLDMRAPSLWRWGCPAAMRNNLRG